MKMSDFDYELPPEYIAQTPVEPRDSSRLLVINRATSEFTHRHFRDIGEYLRPGDLLIANQSRVIPARLFGHRAASGGAVEILLLAERPDLGMNYWETIARPGRKLRTGERILLGSVGEELWVEAEVMSRTDAGGRIMRFYLIGRNVPPHASEESLSPYLDTLGNVPLPPYIHETLQDPERYQTVYARIRGSAAAPTAGLHFTPRLLEQLQQQGVRVGFVTLHVGLDTFRPVEEEDYTEHKIHSEEIELDAPTAQLINETRQQGGRIVAVGTTSVRVLESIASLYDGRAEPYKGHTSLYITPGYRYRLVDAMITNFHLPRSTLLLLVSAFMGKDLMEKAYQEAIKEHYRFFSFGDAMLIL